VGGAVPFLIALVLACILTRATMAIAPRVGLVDRPGALKIHALTVPATGGIAVVIASLLVWRPAPAIAVAICIALVTGTVDDLRSLSPLARVLAQTLCGAVLVAGGLRLEPLGLLGSPALVLATVALANAMNMVDGQDGLAGGLAAIASLGLAAVMAASGIASVVPVALSGALAGFLVWNRPTASVFLGDGGAYAVGVTLAAIAAQVSAAGWPWLLAAGCCLGVFAYELIATVLRRRRSSAASTTGDREHTYDRLTRRLGSRSRSTVLMFALGVAAAAIGLAVARAPIAAGLALIGGLVLVVAALDARLLPLAPQGDTS
jgi:UDP-GlcNAc:undecaprenyl-phosphate/decaprenyl-phosphate GlcNAc-1-phosphate transferase